MAISLTHPGSFPTAYATDAYDSTNYVVSNINAATTYNVSFYTSGGDTGVPQTPTVAAQFRLQYGGNTYTGFDTNNGGVGFAIPNSVTSFSVVALQGAITNTSSNLTYRVRVTDDSTTAYRDDSIILAANPTTIDWQWTGVTDVYTRSDASTVNYVQMFASVTPGGNPNHSTTETITWSVQSQSGFGTTALFYRTQVYYTTLPTQSQGILGKTAILVPAGTANGSTVTFRVYPDSNPAIYKELIIHVDNTKSVAATINPPSITINPSSGAQNYDISVPTNTEGTYGGYLGVVQTSGSGNSATFTGDNYTLNRTHTFVVTETAVAEGTFTLTFYPFLSQLVGETGPSYATCYGIVHPTTGSALTISSPASLSPGVVGVAYGPVTFAYTGTPIGVVAWSATGLPSGLNMSSVGVLSGTPTQTGNFSVTVTLTDTHSAIVDYYTKVYSLTIGTGSSGNPQITGVSPSTVTQSGQQLLTISGSNFASGDVINFDMVGVPAGPGTTKTLGAPINYVSTTTITGLAPAFSFPGDYIVSLWRLGVYKTAWSIFTVARNTDGPVLTSISPTTKNVGDADFTLTANGSQFASNNSVILFNGVQKTTTFVNSTQLTCTITTAEFPAVGNYNVQIKNTSDNQYSESIIPLVVSGTALSFTPTTITAVRGSAYGGSGFTGTGGAGGPYTFTSPYTTLPDGLILSSSGTISGTPTPTANTKTVKIRVQDSSSGVNEIDVVFNISGGTLTISTPTTLTAARIGSSYNANGLISVSGGVPPYTWGASLTSGTLPTGMSWNSTTHTFEGTPTDITQINNTFHPQVTVTDSAGSPNTTSKTFDLQLLAAISTPTVTDCTPPTGTIAGGTAVVITGTNFLAGTPGPGGGGGSVIQVYFGSTLASNILVTDTSHISCSTPSSATAGPVNIRVVNPDSGEATLASGFTYQDIQTPVISSIDKPNGPFAGGRTIVITGTNFTSITAVKIGGILASGITNPNSTTVTCITPAFSGGVQDSKQPVNVDVTNSAGTGTFVNGYTYRPLPKINAITPNQASTAGGTTAYITGTHFFSQGGTKPRVFIGGVEVDPANITLVGGEN